jgi:hypothetical protein
LWLGSKVKTAKIVIKIRPNQGIWRSAYYALLTGLGAGLVSAAGIGLLTGLILGPLFGVAFGPPFGVAIELFASLFFGGEPCIQHLLLRLIFYGADYIPWNYAHFLDYAAERIFLYKMGGGYIFVHRLLLKYFAALRI